MTNTNTPPAGNISAAPRYKARWLTVRGFLMAMNTVLSSFSIPVAGGHFYLHDVILVAAALSLDPLGAFLVGGVGAFLGDFFFYPLPMFVSLATHGLEAVVISLFARRYGKKNLPLTFFGVFLGALIVVIGYSLGRAYVYSTPEYSLIKLPFEILQAGIGAILGAFIRKNRNMGDIIRKVISKQNDFSRLTAAFYFLSQRSCPPYQLFPFLVQ